MFDARYDYTGRVDYIKLTEKLIRELSEYGKIPDRQLWIEEQVKFLEDHDLITVTARTLRSVSVEQQIKELRKFQDEMN